jgi:predicted MPP superfamily phosphohydrolase
MKGVTSLERHVLLRFALFFGVVLLLLGGTARYVQRRTSRVFGLGPKAQRAIGWGLAVALGLAALTRGLEGRLPDAWMEPLGLAAFVVVLGLLLVLLPLLLLQLGTTVARVRRRWRRAIEPPVGLPPPAEPLADPSASTPLERAPAEEPAEPELGRRSFLEQAAAGAILSLGFGAATYGTVVGRRDWRLETVHVALPRLSPRLAGLVVAQLSDLHIGLFVGHDELAAAEELLREARADLIVLTGDLLDHDARHAPVLERFVGRIGALAPRGVYAIAGNHDYYAGIDQTLAAVERAGGRVLRNRGALVGDGEAAMALLGVDDLWGPRVDPRSRGADLAAALASLPDAASLPRLLLCHNPIYFGHAAGQVALQLSGHTHGSQVNVGHALTSLFLHHPYVAGRFERDGSQLYVNRGFGTAGPPTRLGSPPEVTRLVLSPA